MWVIINCYKDIVKFLLDYGVFIDIKFLSGRIVLDFVLLGSEMFDFFQYSGYNIGNVGVGDDFYNKGFF